jgi:23S rRNA (cytosine1962-C5)-methyltransferase
MYASDEYQLLDFGSGRKLERFGPYILDRPSPAAAAQPCHDPDVWSQAHARFDRTGGAGGSWTSTAPITQPWHVHFGPLALELKLTDAAQLGVFPEQAANWQWLDAVVRRMARQSPPKVLNLFAYTGASTLAAAAAGAEVVHVDAAPGVVAWARRNAQTCNLDRLPIRWITEDVLKFVRREQRRGNRYDAVILDPPAYGHGPRGQSWKLESHLDELLSLCLELCRGPRQFLLLTCHSPPLSRGCELLEYVIARHPRLRAAGELTGVDMWLDSAHGRRLHCGAAVRWCAQA